jgi:hypothetical protein
MRSKQVWATAGPTLRQRGWALERWPGQIHGLPAMDLASMDVGQLMPQLRVLQDAVGSWCQASLQHMQPASLGHDSHQLKPAVWTGPAGPLHRVLKGRNSAPQLQPLSCLTFTLHGPAAAPRGRRVVRMPLPWASITAPDLSSLAGEPVPRLLGPREGQSGSQTKEKEEPAERILISEVGPPCSNGLCARPAFF